MNVKKEKKINTKGKKNEDQRKTASQKFSRQAPEARYKTTCNAVSLEIRWRLGGRGRQCR